MDLEPLKRAQLRTTVRAEELAFESTAELPTDERIVGQERAVDALRFGIGMHGAGYNIFAMGPDGVGKFTVVRHILLAEAAARPIPNDWVYVFDFDHPARPQALCLPPGRGAQFAEDVHRIVEGMGAAWPATFRREEYQARHEEIEEELQVRQQEAMNAVRERARSENVVLVETPTGFAFAPLDEQGEAMKPAQFEKLPEPEQQRIKAIIEALQDELQRVLRQFPSWHRETHDKLKALHREMAEFAVGNLIDAVMARYRSLPEAFAYLERTRRDIVENANAFLPVNHPASEEWAGAGENPLERYRVNVLVDHGQSKVAPVEIEDLPTHGNLIGRTEYRSRMGTLVTDHALIKAGALHRANGGFLFLDARRVLSAPYAWEALKSALRAREIRIEPLERSLGWLTTASLEPQPIPLDVKVVMTGNPELFYLLQTYDPDFSDLFKVAADFDYQIVRDDTALMRYARVIAAIVQEHELQPLARDAVAEAIEYAARLVEDAERLSTHMRSIADLLREADYWARQTGDATTGRGHIRKAIDQKVYRAERLRERVYESIQRGTRLVSTDGANVGQINGLSVVTLGEFAFGQPVRITATTRLGSGKVIDIEREAELGGALHSKGVLILSNFLAARFSRNLPLSLSASLVFEQSYGMVEGDSASLAELCVLLSSLAGVPIRQSLAVTGSVNQFGVVQAIGGVNEKIEAFFDVCRRRGPGAGQGVVIPESNVQHLMLRHDVVEAAGTGSFHVWAVRTVDEAIEVLTGVPAGVPDAAGVYPPGTVNRRAFDCLQEFSQRRRVFMHDGQPGEGDGGS